MILLDTCIVIDILHPFAAKSPVVPPFDELGICGITRTELFVGARTALEREEIKGMLDMIHDIPVSATAWEEAGICISKLKKVGVIIPLPDAVLACAAVDLSIPLWTTDKHFKTIKEHYPKLKLYFPSSPSSGPGQP